MIMMGNEKVSNSNHTIHRMGVVWIGLLLIVLVFSLLCFSFGWGTAEGKTITVDDDGANADYTDLIEALGGAEDGDTLFIRNGTYFGEIQGGEEIWELLKNNVTLQGESRGSTVLRNMNFYHRDDWDFFRNGISMNNITFIGACLRNPFEVRAHTFIPRKSISSEKFTCNRIYDAMVYLTRRYFL